MDCRGVVAPRKSIPLVVSELWRPYQVVVARVGTELEGCISRAVLGHQLLSRTPWLLVQQ